MTGSDRGGGGGGGAGASPRVLLVEDDASLREVLAFNLSEGGFEVQAEGSGQAALASYDPERFDVVLTDLRMPGLDGLELLRRLRARAPEVVVVVMTAFGSVDAAVEAMQEGAFHYVEKPVNTRSLLALLARAAEFGRLGQENRRLQDAVRGAPESYIISTSPAMNEVLRRVDKVAGSDATILIRGESGTGKELVARALHSRSARRGRPFVAVNCAAIPTDLLESVLFGHERGAFTGAAKASRGKFAAADRGTLFLDEIGDMAPRLQSKLLRVLQDGEVDIVGATRPLSVDVRVVAATHRDLEAMVAEGTFRGDLYYRLNVVPIEIPPLRRRLEDIPVLFRHFLRLHQPDREPEVDRQVDAALLAHDWPGNVRELDNLAQRVVLLGEGGRIRVDDLPPALRAAGAGPGTRRPDPSPARGSEGAPVQWPAGEGGLPFGLPDEGLDLTALERQVIAAALAKHAGNQSATARYLRIPRHVLLYRMEKFGLKGRE